MPRPAVLYLKLVGIDIVEAELLLKVLTEICKSSGEDSGLVAHPPEDLHHTLESLVQRQVARDILHHRHVESISKQIKRRERR